MSMYEPHITNIIHMCDLKGGDIVKYFLLGSHYSVRKKNIIVLYKKGIINQFIKIPVVVAWKPDVKNAPAFKISNL